jgi:hypothetical protein
MIKVKQSLYRHFTGPENSRRFKLPVSMTIGYITVVMLLQQYPLLSPSPENIPGIHFC